MTHFTQADFQKGGQFYNLTQFAADRLAYQFVLGSLAVNEHDSVPEDMLKETVAEVAPSMEEMGFEIVATVLTNALDIDLK